MYVYKFVKRARENKRAERERERESESQSASESERASKRERERQREGARERESVWEGYIYIPAHHSPARPAHTTHIIVSDARYCAHPH